ncbi:hypothetical protein ES703_59056 [subsurface metagenome]
MDEFEHYKSLKKMYLSAPVNEIYNPKIQVDNGTAEIEIEVNEKYFHSAGLLFFIVFMAKYQASVPRNGLCTFISDSCSQWNFTFYKYPITSA